jgi:hypothetical protein
MAPAREGFGHRVGAGQLVTGEAPYARWKVAASHWGHEPDDVRASRPVL